VSDGDLVSGTWRDDPEAGFTDGPELPQPPSKIAETGAAMEGAMKVRADHPGLASALAHLLDVSPEEAATRFLAWAEFLGLCSEIFRSWCSQRGLIALGYVWDGPETDPIFYAQRGDRGGF
jgi:hypothetical protein